MKPAPQKYRTTSWKTYNEALTARGSLLIKLDPTMKWHGHLVKMRVYWRVDKHTKRERDIGRHRDADATLGYSPAVEKEVDQSRYCYAPTCCQHRQRGVA
jgi:hypothetical protein